MTDDYMNAMFRNNVLPLVLTLNQVFDYLGLGSLSRYETTLIERINSDAMPIRIKALEEQTFAGRLVHSIELHSEKNLIFSKTKKYVPNNVYKILELNDDKNHTVVDVSKNNILITHEQMYAKRDEIVEYYRNDLQKDSPLIRPAIKVSEREKSDVKETIQDKRFKRFEEICAEIAQQKKLPDQKHQTIYDSFVPPMTKRNFYNYFAQFTAEDNQLFAFNYGDFFRDKRVKVEFCKSARNRK
jgi:hypothetical protein